MTTIPIATLIRVLQETDIIRLVVGATPIPWRLDDHSDKFLILDEHDSNWRTTFLKIDNEDVEVCPGGTVKLQSVEEPTIKTALHLLKCSAVEIPIPTKSCTH